MPAAAGAAPGCAFVPLALERERRRPVPPLRCPQGHTFEDYRYGSYERCRRCKPAKARGCQYICYACYYFVCEVEST